MRAKQCLMTCLLAAGCLLVPYASQAWSQPYFKDVVQLAQYPPQENVIFNNGNIDAVQNTPVRRTVFYIDMPYLIVQIQNYHYFNYGRPPGYIGLRAADGTRYGPWPAIGQTGQGGVPNAYWNCYPNITIPPGRYTVEDSDPATWSQNAGSDYRGITLIKGRPMY